MKLRADVEFDELLKYGFKKDNGIILGCDHLFIRYRYVAQTSRIEIFPFDINGEEDRSIFVIDELVDGSINDEVLDKLHELIVAGLIEAPKPILPVPKPTRIEQEVLDRFFTMVTSAITKTMKEFGFVVNLGENNDKEG